MALKHTFSQFCIYLLLAVGLVSWPGCDDDEMPPPPECTFGDIFQLNYTDYCDPELLKFRIASSDVPQPVGLPNFCFDDYTDSRSFQLEVPAGGTIYLHRYRDFPADITMEFIGTNCEAGDYTLLNGCNYATSRRLVETYEVDASGFTTLIVRAVFKQNSDYVPGTREDDVLDFAAFTSPYTPAQIVNNGENPLALDCNGELPSFILSPRDGGISPIDAAISLGFPFEACDCDEDIVLVELPPGVSLNRVRPRVQRDETETDTTHFNRNRLIATPVTQFTNTDFGNPQQDPNVGGNPCLDFQDPNVGGGFNGLRVAIIDSGVEDGPNPFFQINADPNPEQSCVSHGPLGYDFIEEDDTPNDMIGHGTLVGSAYLSGLSGNFAVTLVNYKFLDTEFGTLFNAMCATSTALKTGANIINMSWGFPSSRFPPVLETLLNRAQDQKVLIVTSAGNDQRDVQADPIYWPAFAGAIYPNVVTVAAHSVDGSSGPFLVDFSNFSSDAVGIAAPYSTQARDANGAVIYPSGTSISAPIVARKLTEVAEPGMEPEVIINNLFMDGSKVGQNDNFIGQILERRFLRTLQFNPANGGCEIQL